MLLQAKNQTNQQPVRKDKSLSRELGNGSFCTVRMERKLKEADERNSSSRRRKGSCMQNMIENTKEALIKMSMDLSKASCFSSQRSQSRRNKFQYLLLQKRMSLHQQIYFRSLRPPICNHSQQQQQQPE